MLKDDAADVRAAAVRALADLGDESGARLLSASRRHGRGVVITAAGGAGASGRRAIRGAERALSRLIGDTRSCAAGRRVTRPALGAHQEPVVRWLLIR
jgi:biotin carboxylase